MGKYRCDRTIDLEEWIDATTEQDVEKEIKEIVQKDRVEDPQEKHQQRSADARWHSAVRNWIL